MSHIKSLDIFIHKHLLKKLFFSHQYVFMHINVIISQLIRKNINSRFNYKKKNEKVEDVKNYKGMKQKKVQGK